MRIEKIEFGIHTMELYAKDLKYQEVQKVIDRLIGNGSIWKMRSDPYNIDRHLASTFLVDDGIRLRIHQSHNKSNGVALIVNPSTHLSRKYQPTKLYHPKKKSCEELLERVGAALIKIGLGTFDSDDVVFIVPPDELSLSQIDLTVNLWFDEETDLEEIIRLFRKGRVPKNFSRQNCLSEEEPPICYQRAALWQKCLGLFSFKSEIAYKNSPESGLSFCTLFCFYLVSTFAASIRDSAP